MEHTNTQQANKRSKMSSLQTHNYTEKANILADTQLNITCNSKYENLFLQFKANFEHRNSQIINDRLEQTTK